MLLQQIHYYYHLFLLLQIILIHFVFSVDIPVCSKKDISSTACFPLNMSSLRQIENILCMNKKLHRKISIFLIMFNFVQSFSFIHDSGQRQINLSTLNCLTSLGTMVHAVHMQFVTFNIFQNKNALIYLSSYASNTLTENATNLV